MLIKPLAQVSRRALEGRPVCALVDLISTSARRAIRGVARTLPRGTVILRLTLIWPLLILIRSLLILVLPLLPILLADGRTLLRKTGPRGRRVALTACLKGRQTKEQ